MDDLTYAKESLEHEIKNGCAQMGALWNLLFPNEKDDWDYRDQMYRLVFAQVAWMKNILSYYERNSPDTYPAAVVLNAKAGEAEYVDPKPYEWKEETK